MFYVSLTVFPKHCMLYEFIERRRMGRIVYLTRKHCAIFSIYRSVCVTNGNGNTFRIFAPLGHNDKSGFIKNSRQFSANTFLMVVRLLSALLLSSLVNVYKGKSFFCAILYSSYFIIIIQHRHRIVVYTDVKRLLAMR